MVAGFYFQELLKRLVPILLEREVLSEAEIVEILDR